jgi:dTDP-4-dehydrorhamnose 3,5-epimerase-like enzyme
MRKVAPDKKRLAVKNCRWLHLSTFDDGTDGFLTIAEDHRHIPFSIKRAYFVRDLHNPSALRGMHAHRKQEQALFCLNGSFELEMFDGRRRAQAKLDRPDTGIYVGPDVWLALRSFSDDCLIAVFASDHYHESDYIRDFREFRSRTSRRRKK